MPTDPSFSFGIKTNNGSLFPEPKIIKRSLSPGPGTYQTNGNDQNNVSFAFSKSDYEKVLYEKLKGLPGPGQYDPKVNPKKESPKYRFIILLVIYYLLIFKALELQNEKMTWKTIKLMITLIRVLLIIILSRKIKI